MAKQVWKPGNMVYPVPAVMVTVADKEGNANIITVAWTGTVCTNPPMAYISVRPERYSYHMLEETGEFAINLTTKELVYATDYCGVKSGRDTDKFEALHLTKGEAAKISVPVIKESPVNIECKVVEKRKLGSHTMFLAEVVAVQADENYLDEQGRFDLSLAEPIVYSHGEYYSLDEKLGKFGYSISKKPSYSRKRIEDADRRQEAEPGRKQTEGRERKNSGEQSKKQTEGKYKGQTGEQDGKQVKGKRKNKRLTELQSRQKKEERNRREEKVRMQILPKEEKAYRGQSDIMSRRQTGNV